jgi:signal transduction histidine kinase
VRPAWIAVAVAGIAGGVAVDAWTFGPGQPVLAIPDLAVGVVLILAGTSMATRVPGTGGLLLATAATWFAGTAVPAATYWHRGVLVHLLVACPGIRLGSRGRWVLAGAGYATAVAVPIWQDDATSLILALLAVLVAGAGLRRARARRRRTRQIACAVGCGLAGVVLLGSAARLAVPGGAAVLPSLLAYEAALIAAAAVLWSGLRPAGVGAVTDLVVELGADQPGSLRDALADLLGDPDARLGYWHAASARYVDEAGGVLAAPAAGDPRTLTRMDRNGLPFAALLHDSAIGPQAALAGAVAAADRLTAAHAALRSDVRARLAEVSRSRSRLQAAVDGERLRLERRLAGTTEARLAALADDLRRLPTPRDAHLVRARDQLALTRTDLHDVAQGLYPRELAGGLAGALGALAGRCCVPVELGTVPRRFDPEIEVAVYYLCAEALANVVKHARARAAWIDVAVRAGMLVVTVSDDGVGGAAVTRGTGLLGLRDRVESAGGTLRVDSAAGAGTTLAAEFPLGGRRA